MLLWLNFVDVNDKYA